MVVASVVDYLSAFVGGLLIGLTATLNLWIMGRITGMSGIFGSLIKFDIKGGFYWKYAFFVGLFTAGLPLWYASEDGAWYTSRFTLVLFDSSKVASADLHIVGWVVGGLLVGFGTKLGNGCTSGHGICGLPRLSIRSIVAVITFMGVGVAMATTRYYVGFLQNGQYFGEKYDDAWNIIGGVLAGLLLIVGIILAIVRYMRGQERVD
jgi:uncharacterized membrane protein YedE/YeeE